MPNQMLLLQTFLHPTNQIGASFGSTLASAGTRVIVGTPGDPVGGQNSGAVYLFDSITGNLLEPVFNNPTPAAGDRFGFSLAVVGDKVLIGAPSDDTHGTNAGAAYLFDIATGELLQTFFSPAPLAGAQFGFSLAAVDEDRVIIGTPSQNVPQNSGAAYVFSIPSRVTVMAPGETATLHFPKIVDDDADGVPNNIEDRPGGIVDSNGDGVADRQQSNVATLRAADGDYVTLVAPEWKSFVDVRVSSNVPAAAPPGTTFPMGLFDFILDGVAQSTSVDINVTFHSGQNFNDYYAFGPTLDNVAPHLVRFRVRYGHDDRSQCAYDRGTSDDHPHRWHTAILTGPRDASAIWAGRPRSFPTRIRCRAIITRAAPMTPPTTLSRAKAWSERHAIFRGRWQRQWHRGSGRLWSLACKFWPAAAVARQWSEPGNHRGGSRVGLCGSVGGRGYD